MSKIKLNQAQLKLVDKFAKGFASTAAIAGSMRADALNAAHDAWNSTPNMTVEFADAFADAAVKARGLKGNTAKMTRANMLAVFFGGAYAAEVIEVQKRILAKPPRGVHVAAMQPARVIEHVSRAVKNLMTEGRGDNMTLTGAKLKGNQAARITALEKLARGSYKKGKSNARTANKAEAEASENRAEALRDLAAWFAKSRWDFVAEGILSDKAMEAVSTLAKEMTDANVKRFDEVSFD